MHRVTCRTRTGTAARLEFAIGDVLLGDGTRGSTAARQCTAVCDSSAAMHVLPEFTTRSTRGSIAGWGRYGMRA